MNQKNPPIPIYFSISFRSILFLVIILIFTWVSFNFAHYYQTKQQIRNLFQQEAREMTSTLVLGERAMTRMMARLEEEQANRLLAIGFWLRDREIQKTLTSDDLYQAAKIMHIFNVVVFNSQGAREFGLRGGPPPWAGRGERQRGRGQLYSHEVEQFIQSDAAYHIEGLHQSSGSGGSRFSVLVRRLNGGVLMINIDAQEQDKIIRQFGPSALLTEFADRSNIHYLIRKTEETIKEQYGKKEPDTEHRIFEVEIPLSNSDNESLVIGFDNQPILENDRILFQRMLISFSVVGFLGLMILLWSRLQTSYVQQAKELRQFQSYHQTVLETMEEAVIAWNEKGKIIFWNPKAEKLFPILSTDSTPETIPDPIKNICERMGNNGEDVIMDIPEPERGIRRYRAGKTMIQEPFPTQVLFLTDVTAVEEATRERDRREHLEALAKVASGVAHEVRNPLNTIDMSIQTLCMEPSTLQPDDRATLESLRGEIKRINAIVEHFLAYGRPQPPVFSEVDMNSIIKEIVLFLEPTVHDKNIRLLVETTENSKVHADAQQIKQALLNVVLNAIDASKAGQEIRLRTEDREDGVVCICQDQGCGMTKAQIQNIFDPYVTHKPGGTGLGMSIVKRILETHQGTIEISSVPDQGTVVKLSIPKFPL